MEVLLIFASILFNPLVWIVAAIAIAVVYSRKSRARKATTTEPSTQDGFVRDEFGALRLEDMAERVRDDKERHVLLRAANSLRYGRKDMMADIANQAPPSAPATAQLAPVATRSADGLQARTTPNPLPTNASELKEPQEPLTERGLKALQNINILLYLGAFFIIVAAGVFVGSTYNSINDTSKVFLLGLFAAAFYLSGLALYRLTDKIKPAGVTFTAIGLLVTPLVGVAAQNLLYADKNPGPVWLITSVALLIMQVVAFVVIHKSYIAYYAALTTISLFQAITSTASADVYWYGWVMLATSMVFVGLSKATKDAEVGEPFRIVAQIFVPIAVVLSFLGIDKFGLWHVGVQLVLTSLFYFLCALLKNFDESDEDVLYITLAAALFPIGFSLALAARDVPRLFIAILLIGFSLTYILAEKLAPERRHKPVYGALSVIIASVAPLVLIGSVSSATITWLVLAATVSHAIHYIITRYRASFTLMQLGLLSLPLLFGRFIMTTPLGLERIGAIMLVAASIMTLVAILVFRVRNASLLAEQTGWILVAIAIAAGSALVAGQIGWLTAILGIGAGLVLALAYFCTGWLLAIAATTAYMMLFSLTAWQDLSLISLGGLTAALALVIYGLYRLVSRFRVQQLPAAYGYLTGLMMAYVFAAVSSSNVFGAVAIMGLIAIFFAALTFSEHEKTYMIVAIITSYGAVMKLASTQDWPIALPFFVWSVVLYALGSSYRREELDYARYGALAGSLVALFAAGESGVNKWLAVMIHAGSAGLVMGESYRKSLRWGKYIGSAIVWSAVLRLYDAAGVTLSQVYIQTTASYFGALAYRQYQRGEKQLQDILTVVALIVATVPLAFQALDDKSGGYTLAILGLGLALTVGGMSMHNKLVRTWGIATLVIIVLYRTAGTIFQLPAWVWLGVIGGGTLVGAIYLLSRRPHDIDVNQAAPKEPPKKT